jgi:putative membrane protein
MSNQQLIKSAHIWALAGLLMCGAWAIAGKAGIRNQNSNQNSNTGSSTRSQNANRSNRNSRNSNAMGEQAGMASMTAQDRNFLMDAAMGGMEEVELGRMATQQGSSDAVKQFGQRMVDDHTKANQDLMSVAQGKGITLPTTLDEKHQKEVTKFSSLTGAEFDREYTKMMVSDHRKDVSEFEKESTRGTDADLKSFATRTLPTLQEHLQLAESLPGAPRAGGGSNMNSTMNSNSNRGGSRNSNSNSNRNRNGNSNNSNQP